MSLIIRRADESETGQFSRLVLQVGAALEVLLLNFTGHQVETQDGCVAEGNPLMLRETWCLL